jgi:hypothetical protein
MINYLYINSSSLGKLAISTFVFIQLAQERLEVLSQGDLKNSLCLSSTEDANPRSRRLSIRPTTSEAFFGGVRLQRRRYGFGLSGHPVRRL